MPQQAFEDSAVYYEALTNRVQRLEREGPLLLECLRQAPGKKVVDLACGTGLHAEFLAQHGAEVTACDLSPAMLAHAQKTRPHPRIDYRVGDMRELDGGPWHLAVCLGNSLSLLAHPDEVPATFRTLREHLAPGGLVLAQVLNYQAESARQPRHRIERVSLDNGELIAVKNLVPTGGRTLLNLTFFALRGESVATISENAVLLHLTRPILEAAATSAGFELSAIYGGMDRRPFDAASSPDLVLLARNPR